LIFILVTYYGTLPNLIFKKIPTQKGKGKKKKRGPTSNQERTPKNANAPTRATKESNVIVVALPFQHKLNYISFCRTFKKISLFVPKF